VAALTEVEARTRAGLLDVDSYEVFLDLTVQPVRSRTETRFRCREPGAASFADLAAGSVLGAVLNGRRLGPPVDGRLALPELGADNVLTAEAEVAWSRSGQGLTSFTDPADGATYVTLTCYPSSAPGVFCCFDQSDLTAAMTLSVAVPDGWECIASGPVTQRPSEGRSGLWQFAPVPAMAPCEVALCAGPLVTDWHGDGCGGHVAMTVRRRRSLGGADGVAGLGTFGELSRRAIEQYERLLGVPCAFPKYDMVAVPDLAVLAESMSGLTLVNESLLARMIDPDDDKVAIVAAHEAAHLWFGSLVGARWWDDVWLDEAMATYLCYTIMSDPVDAGTPDMVGPWTAFCYRHELAAYRADELPGAEPVSAPVASATEALAKPPAITYHKGAAVIRQLAALIGDDALHGGLGDYLTRYRASGVAALDDLIACLSRASGRDLAGWADEWLRTEGASTLRPELTAAPDGTIGSLAVTQDRPRTQLIGIGLYDLDGTRLHRRQVVHAEVGGERTPVPSLAGEKLPDAVVLNDGDLSYTRVRFDERTLRTLAAAAMDVGDPLTEAVCWTAAWQLVIAAELAAADFADLVIRRLAGPALTGPPSASPPIPGLPLVGVETLLERAVECADVYAPPADRAAIRERVAGTVLELTERNPGSIARGPTPQPRAPVPRRAAGARDDSGNHTRTSGQREHPSNSAASPRQQALAAGFAASAHSTSQLDLLRSWLSGDLLPDGLSLTADLRARVLFTLSARGLADDGNLDALAAADPVAGEQHRATCRAMRPDPSGKEAAWQAALADDQDLRMAEAHARGLWVAGQEDLMAGYRDRYFTEALPALADREPQTTRRLARLLYPATLVSPATVAATDAALQAGHTGGQLRVIVQEQQAILRSALAARSTARWLKLS
jgi:aminopeptidase N